MYDCVHIGNVNESYMEGIFLLPSIYGQTFVVLIEIVCKIETKRTHSTYLKH